MARRFVSSFIYKTDATFNTNCLKLLLNVIVGINNCRRAFPIAYYYITLELVVSFKFVANQLTDLAFYNDPKAAIIVGDFSKRLRAAVDLRLTTITKEALVCILDRDEELPKAACVVVAKDNRSS